MTPGEVFELIKSKLPEAAQVNGTSAVYKCPEKRRQKHVITLLEDKVELHCTGACTVEEISQQLELTEAATQWKEAQRIEVAQRLCSQLAEGYLHQYQMPVFEITGLPPLLQDYVGNVSELTGSDTILTTIAALSTLSAYAMHRRKLVGYFQDLHPCIWSLTLSASGAFKSTGLRLGTQVLRDMDGELLKHIKAAEDSEDELRKVTLQKQLRSLPDSFSWQGLLDKLHEQGGGLMMQSEFSSFLHNLGAKWNEGAKARFTSIYDVVEPIEERTRGNATIRIEEPYVSICGVSTIEFIRELITTEDVRSGFLPRFLMFSPPSTSNSIPAALPSVATCCNSKEWDSYQRLSKLCQYLLHSELKVGSASNMSPEARESYTQHHDAIYSWVFEQEQGIQNALYSFAKRWGPSLLKLAMLMQLLINPRQVEPDEEAIHSAYQVLLYAMGSTKQLLTQDLGQSPQLVKESKLLTYIAKRGGSLSYRQLLQSHALTGGVREYDYIVETLETKGKIKLTGDTKGSRQVELC